MRIRLQLLVFPLISLCYFIPCTSQGQENRVWTEPDRYYLVTNLERTRTEIIDEIEGLNGSQWDFKENAERWSISQIVEHLELQDEMYYRELFLISKIPEMPEYIEVVKGNDEGFLKYATDTLRGSTSWNLEPTGRFCTKEASTIAFKRVRGKIIEYVNTTDDDLRKHFTFRRYSAGGQLENPSLWDVRDLHQLLLTTIAHTDRHLNQLRKVKKHPMYPQ